MLKFIFLWLMIVPILSFTPEFSAHKYGPFKKTSSKWAVQKTSTIHIQGSSNVNTFGCDIEDYPHPDTICVSEENAASKMVTLMGDLQIDISKFDCHNRMLTHDLRKSLKADEYPTLIIRFLSLDRAPLIHDSKDFLKGWVEIELAGTRRRFEVCYSFIKTSSSLIQLNGNRTFSFADFKLTPPNKLGGLIRVKDKFSVDFNLSLDPVE